MTRVLSALVLIPVVVGTIVFLPPEFTFVLAIVAAVLAFSEYCGIARALGVTVPVAVGGTSVVLVAYAMWIDGQQTSNYVFMVLLAAMVVAGAGAVARGTPSPSALADASATMMAPIYIGLPLGSLAALRGYIGNYAVRSDFAGPFGDGRAVVLLLMAVIVISDSAQYYTGRAFGKGKLAPTISPKKTVEGAIGGMVFGTLAMTLGGLYLFRSPLWILALLGAVVSLLGIVGDLFESQLKRSAGVKDSSNLIPGHGGVLDRIDSWLFAAPVYYVFVRFIA